MTPCSPPSRRGLSAAECEAPFERRPSLTASARDVVGAAGRDEETVLRSNQETEFIRSRRLRRVEGGGAVTGCRAPPAGVRRRVTSLPPWPHPAGAPCPRAPPPVS